MSKEHADEPGENPSPVGTWVLLCLAALGMTAGWLLLYFGVFLPRGAVS